MTSLTEDIEIRLFVEAIHARYGYDFRAYADASLRRRVRAVLIKRGMATLSQLQGEVLRSPSFFVQVLSDLTVTTSEMFRDPDFYKDFREQVVPVLRTYPAFKIWHAGCSTGEELYSMAILLEEAGIYDRAVLYATDINPAALRKAKEGIFPVAEVKRYTANYLASGGRESFSSYYTVAYDGARFDSRLRRNVLFTAHSLVTDEVFSEVHVVLCRNVFIYFDRTLQARALDLITRSLRYKGYLCLGSKETVRFVEGGSAYEEVVGGQKIFRKIVRSRNEDGLNP